MDDWRHMTVDTLFDESNRLRRQSFRKSGMRAGELVEAGGDEVLHFQLEALFVYQLAETLFQEIENFVDEVSGDDVVQATLEQFVDLSVNESRDRMGRLLAL